MSSSWWLPALWFLNGALAVVYTVLEAWRLWLILGAAWPLIRGQADPLRRRWMLGVTTVALLVTFFSPQVVGLMLAMMMLGGWVAWRLEHFNPSLLYWRITQGIGLYSLIASGALIYRYALASASSDWFVSGQRYLEALVAILIYGYPLGYFALLAQALFAHPPLGQTPEEMITMIRTRGKQEKGL